VVVRTPSLTGSAPLDTPPAPIGLRGASVVAACNCAAPAQLHAGIPVKREEVSYVQAQACASPQTTVGVEGEV
jgi:hypothetical protein